MVRKPNAGQRPVTKSAEKTVSGVAALNQPAGTTLVGSSFQIDGEIRGDEDLVVYGRVSGSIDIGEGVLVVTRDACIEADARARVINIEGTARGDLHAREQIIVRKSAHVRGNLSAPRVALDFGCEFSGSVDTSRDEAGVHGSDDDSVALFKAAIAAPADSSKR